MNNIENIKFFLGDLKASNYNVSFIKGVENLIQENKELKEELEICEADLAEMTISNEHKKKEWVNKLVLNSYIPKSKVKELAKKYEFALNGYDSSTADYKQSQNLGRYMACVELLEEGE